MSITFATNCWEKDWKYLLKEGYLERMLNNCDYNFDRKILCIGNVDNLGKVISAADKKIAEGLIDEYIIVEDFSEKVLSFFEIERDDFKGGYNYSISPLTALYKSETDVLLYFTGDAHIVKNNNKWIEGAMKLLLESDKYFVANPLWDNKYAEAKSESFDETEDYFIGFGFSDQCFMVRVADFRKPIYNEKHPASQRYPKYAGELFEKRIDSYMRNHNLLRATSKYTTYIHENYEEKKSFLKHIFGK